MKKQVDGDRRKTCSFRDVTAFISSWILLQTGSSAKWPRGILVTEQLPHLFRF